MDFWERDLSYSIDGIKYYKYSLIHKKLGNQPIIVESKDLYEIYEKKNREKNFLNNEWIKVQLKKEYENLIYERKIFLNKALKETQPLTWDRINIPMKIFSTEIIVYDDKFKPKGYYICGENGEKFNIKNNGRYLLSTQPLAPENKFIQRFIYKFFGFTEDLYALDNEFYREKKKYIENIKRYKRFKEEEEVWLRKYQETYQNRLKNHYLKNSHLIEKQTYNILVNLSKYHSHKEWYKHEFFTYNLSNKRLEFIYLLPTNDMFKEYFKEPNYDKLEWKECTQEDKEKRREQIWNQLMLIAIYEQFRADQFFVIEIILLRSFAWELNRVTGNYKWKKIKEVELSRKDVSGFNFDALDVNACINHYTKKYDKQEEKNSLLEIKNHLSNMEKNIIDSVEDIPYDIDIQPSVNTNIETFNNKDGGVVNFKK
ncbi:MAG TPA: hypothetical protein ENK66_03970 [Arcobacter sp.]|nr:hypothetical protein [Arcobacter sp.]